MFLGLCVILFKGGVSVPACTTGHMTVGGLCPGGLSMGVCPGDGGSLSKGGLCPGVSVKEGLCPGRGLCQGSPPSPVR